MSKAKDSLVRQFKNEYRARIEYQNRMDYLREKLAELEAKFQPHSPMLGGVRVTSQETRDMQLAEYTQKKAKLEKELDTLERQAAKVDKIAELMDETVLYHWQNVLKGKYTLEAAGNRMGLSRDAFKTRLADEIIKAHRRLQI